MKSAERSKPQLGWPRTTDSLCPTCVREARTRILAGEQSIASLVNENVGEIKAHIVERDGKVIVEKTCPQHGTFTDTLAINPDFLRRIEGLFPGPRFRCGHRHAAQPRHVVHQARARSGPDDRPDQPLQHDVRPLLHGRESGRLRPRADARRGEGASGRRADRQAAAADDRAVLRRRADHFADLPRRRAVCDRHRLLQRPGRDQRHSPGAGARVREGRARRRACGSRTCSSTAWAKRRTLTARSATSSTSSCARSRTATPRGSTSASS